MVTQLQQLGRNEGVTLHMTLLAAFQTLLSRYSGQSDIAVGTPIAGRNHVEVENLIGFFVNTLVLRSDLSGAPTFRELLDRVRQTSLEAYEHQDLPFEKLVEELQPERHRDRNPLFQVLFQLLEGSGHVLKLTGLDVERLPSAGERVRFDLEMHLRRARGRCHGTVVYSSDLFDGETIERLVGNFRTLLNGIVDNPGRSIDELPLLSESERHRVLVEWNDTATDFPRDKCVHELFEKRVAQSPDRIAVTFEGQQWTYRKLDLRANQLAEDLQERGVGADVPVGLCLERSLDIVVGVLSILKAGGGYVPIEPDYPRARLEFMVQEAQLSILSVHKRLRDNLPATNAEVVGMDRNWDSIDLPATKRPNTTVKPENLAYVIFTSGSTGKPKGVAMPHRALTNLISWQQQNSIAAEGMRTLQFASISFDVSFQEIFSTLCSGGTLVLINDAQRRDPKALADFIRRQAINRLFLPFVALQQLAEAADASNLIPGDLREIITAGEQLRMTPSIVNWLARLRDCRLHNHYGPTESHVVTAYTSEYPVGDWSKLPPIGRPIANTQIYILDRLLNPVPIGVSGELHIGGAGLARGYLNRPDLTREKFISNPFKISEGKDEGEKLYQTGDLARFTLNGNIEFLGRMDDQVKIRGFRVELGEIEAVLAQHDHVDETVVLAREDIPGNKRLVAYVVPTQEHVPSVEELRRFLRERLPDYMVPAAFAPLAALPLTPNGKVDRRALAAFDVARQTPEETFVAPRTSVEHRLADIWKSVLWLKLEVGVHDNFFDLGGHSLLSVRLVAEIEKVFNKKLPVAALFQLSTIAELAPRLEEDLDATVSSSDARQPIVQGIANSPLDPEIYRQLLAFTAGWKGQRIAPSALMVGQNTAGTRQPLFWCLQGYRELSQLAKYLGDHPEH